MRVKDIMTAPVITVRPDMPIKEAAALLVERAISAVPVVDEAGILIGIVSEADFVRLETEPDPRAHAIPVSHRDRVVPRTVREIMTREVIAAPEDADVAEVARLMLEHHVKRLPVVADERVIGIVSRRDILRMLTRSDAEIRAEVEELLDDEILMIGALRVEVTGGLVTLTGRVRPTARRLAEILTRSVPGVLGVRFGNGDQGTGDRPGNDRPGAGEPDEIEPEGVPR